MSKIIKNIINKITGPDINVKKNYKSMRKILNITKKPLKPLYKMLDYKIEANFHEVPVRVFYPEKDGIHPLIIYYHGGGWVTGNIDTYTKVCANLANETNSIVMSVDYRLAPENPFPIGFNDCYAVTKHIIKKHKVFNIKREDITIMGDSAGANIAAAISLKARDRWSYKVKKQILLYPSTISWHFTDMYPSINEFKDNLILNLSQVNDYIDLYKKNDADLTNPYFAPLNHHNFKRQPDTLIITAEYDLLRDEGEDYGRKLRTAGNNVKIFRMPEVPHAFFTSSSKSPSVKKTYELINEFLES